MRHIVSLLVSLLLLTSCWSADIAVPPTEKAQNVSQSYVQLLLYKFGDGEMMSLEGLEHLLQALGVGDYSNLDTLEDHRSPTGRFLDLHRNHEHGVQHEHVEHVNSNQGDSHIPERQHMDHDHLPEHQHVDHDHDSEHGDGGHDHNGDHQHVDHDHSARQRRRADQEHGLNVRNSGLRTKRQTSDIAVADAARVESRYRRSPQSPAGVSNGSDVIEDDAGNSQVCPGVFDLLAEFFLPPTARLSGAQLGQLCPALLYHTVTGHCSTSHRPNTDTDGHPHSSRGGNMPPLEVWLYALLAVLVISMCGLLGVAVLPIMQRVFYRQLLQFLVALAVGTLAGDALLHLLPHALSPHHGGAGSSHEHHESGEADSHQHQHAERAEGDDELDAVLKGMVALLSLMFFFVAERGIGILHGTCTRDKHKQINKRLADMTGLNRETTEMIERKMDNYRNSAGATHCLGDSDTMDVLAQLNDSHESCDEDNENDAANHNLTPDCSEPQKGSEGCSLTATVTTSAGEPIDSAADPEEHLLKPPLSTAQAQQNRIGQTARIGQGKSSELDGLSPPAAAVPSTSRTRTEEACERFSTQERVPRSNDFTVIIHEHEHRHHGHTHTHGHIHRPAPSSVGAVAGMVIVGDGLHNFTDGLAIGAAFAAGLASGLSTSVAVFCHELPHEIGDFAVLLKSGMSARQAMFYNVVSSVLCLLGMLLGLFLGNIESFTSWIFAAAAGSFLYIALVDMIPELTTDAGGVSQKDSCFMLMTQIIGVCCGAGIMLAIAIYEHDLHSLITVL